MIRSILGSFGRSYGRALGRTAARRTSWLAIPLLIVVAVVALLEFAGGGQITHLVMPVVPTITGLLP